MTPLLNKEGSFKTSHSKGAFIKRKPVAPGSDLITKDFITVLGKILKNSK
jgi:hypothetical protein